MGAVLVQGFNLERSHSSPTQATRTFDAPADGWICLQVLSIGATSATVSLDRAEAVGPNAFRPQAQVIVKVLGIRQGAHTLDARLAGRPQTSIDITVRFAAASPASVSPSTGPAGILTVQNVTPVVAPFSPRRDHTVAASAQTVVKRVAGLQNPAGHQTFLLRYQLQIADEQTCQQMVAVQGEVTIDPAGAVSGPPPGFLAETLIAAWDGRRDDGGLAMAGPYLYRFAVALIKIPPGGTEEILDSVTSAIQRLHVENHCDRDADGAMSQACGGTDCDDNDPAVRPQAPELQDGKDNNCNGVVDEADGWVLESSSQDAYGFVHKRYQYLLDGVHVLGAQRIRHFRDGIQRFVGRDTTEALGTVEPTPTLTPAEAVEALKTQLVAELAAAAGTTDPAWRAALDAYHFRVTGASLRIFDADVYRRTSTEPTHLVYQVPLDVAMYYVNAHDGSVVHRYSLLIEARDRRIHDGTSFGDGGRFCRELWSNLPMPLALNESGGGPTGDQDADRAYEFTGELYDFLFATFGRDGWDGQGEPLVVTVHAPLPVTLDPEWVGSEVERSICRAFPGRCLCNNTVRNAIWMNEATAVASEIALDQEQALFGNGYPARDTIAHEFGHALVERSSGLSATVGGEPAAVSEALADLLAILVDTPDYELGEDTPLGAFRDFAHPERFGHPTNYADLTNEHHKNAGIVNKAHYLMIEGGPFGGVQVRALGRDKVQQIAYLAITQFVVSSETMYDYAQDTIFACQVLRWVGAFGVTTGDCVSVRDAWIAVGVLTGGPHTVGCGGDGDLPTIQEAIDRAVDLDTIPICSGTYHESLHITDRHLTLTAFEGADTVIVFGDSARPVLTLDHAPTVLDGLILRNGASTPVWPGGGISADGSTPLVLRQVQLYGNSGPGVALVHTNLEASDTTIDVNFAEQGAGIHSYESDVRLTGCTLRHNYAVSSIPGRGGTGGGIYAYSGSLVIDHTTIESNGAGYGGGIYGVALDLSLRASEMRANEGMVAGGAIAGLIDHIWIENSRLYENLADHGAALFVTDCIVEVLSSEIMYNVAALSGGGIKLLTSQLLLHNPPDFWLRSTSSSWQNTPNDVDSAPDTYNFGTSDFTCRWDTVFSMTCQ